MPRLTVSEIAEKYLNQWAEALTTGEIQLWELPSSVAQFYYLGAADQRILGNDENSQLRRELNRLNILAFTTDTQRRELLLNRLAKGLTEADEQQWQQLEQDLRTMQALKMNSNETSQELEVERVNGHDNRNTGSSRRTA